MSRHFKLWLHFFLPVEHNESRKKRRCELSDVFHSGCKVGLYVSYKDGRTLCVGFAHYTTNHMPVVSKRISLESLPFFRTLYKRYRNEVMYGGSTYRHCNRLLKNVVIRLIVSNIALLWFQRYSFRWDPLHENDAVLLKNVGVFIFLYLCMRSYRVKVVVQEF